MLKNISRILNNSVYFQKIVVCKGLITHNDILNIYRIIQYFKNIFKFNIVKNIFKMYKKITFLLKKNNFCIMN